MELDLARLGEHYVVEYLLDRGWSCLGQNYRGQGFELDLMMLERQTLVVVEVKTRRCLKYEQQIISDMMPFRKRQCLQRGLLHYISKNPNQNFEDIRLDLSIVEYACSDKGEPTQMIYLTNIDFPRDGD